MYSLKTLKTVNLFNNVVFIHIYTHIFLGHDLKQHNVWVREGEKKKKKEYFGHIKDSKKDEQQQYT